MKRCIVSAPLVLGLMLGATGARAMDLGVIGPTYEISEPHLLQMIEQRLRAKERSGELGRLEAQVRERGIATVKNPVMPSHGACKLLRPWLSNSPSDGEPGGRP